MCACDREMERDTGSFSKKEEGKQETVKERGPERMKEPGESKSSGKMYSTLNSLEEG